MKVSKFIEFLSIAVLFFVVLSKELNALDCRQFVFAPQCRGVSKKSLDFEPNLLDLSDDNINKINELKSQMKENKLIRILLNNWSKEFNGKEEDKDQVI